nr:retrovirus-related Pol polyprotein from transposon TNT 1-94 [Tanacetum cinerariifolium]
MASASPICLIARASSTKSWLWHQRLSHLNFDTINDLAKNDLVSAIATVCFTQNRSIIHRRFNKTPYELINGRKPDISFLHVFGALYYPKNDRKDIGKLGAKAMAFEQCSSKLGLQSMTSGQISSELDLTYAPSTITTQQPTEDDDSTTLVDGVSKGLTNIFASNIAFGTLSTSLESDELDVLEQPEQFVK